MTTLIIGVTVAMIVLITVIVVACTNVEPVRVIPARARCKWCEDLLGDDDLTIDNCNCTEPCAYKAWCKAGREALRAAGETGQAG